MGFSKKLKNRYGKRVQWTCERCGKQWSDGWMLEFHHRLPRSSNGRDTIANMELLCVECHYNVHVELAKFGGGHPSSPSIILSRLKKYKGRQHGR